MTDDFLWGGINIRKFYRLFIRDFWMVLAVMIIAYLGLGFVDKLTYTPQYSSTTVVAVYPKFSSYHNFSIETTSDLSSKATDANTVFNSSLFQSGLLKQDPTLRDCYIYSSQVGYTNLLVMHSISSNLENAHKGILAAIDYYSQFSTNMTGASEIKILLGPEPPILVDGSSKIKKYRPLLCAALGLMMAGLVLLIYVTRKTYKTERRIRKRYKNIRFFSLPVIKSESEDINRILSKKNKQEPIKKVALEIKQVLHKYNKKTLFVTSYADKEGGNAFLSELTRELEEQNENVILIGTEAGPENTDEVVTYSVDDARRVLSNCLGHADIVLVNGTAWYPSHYAQIWLEAADASIALCREDDADFIKVDQILSDLQKKDSYFAGCVLLGF